MKGFKVKQHTDDDDQDDPAQAHVAMCPPRNRVPALGGFTGEFKQKAQDDQHHQDDGQGDVPVVDQLFPLKRGIENIADPLHFLQGHICPEGAGSDGD